MMELLENLRGLADDIEWRLPAAKRSEASTSQFLVMPFFEALGYSVHNPNHVEPEFTADVGIQREKVDFALKQDGKPVILVEVKYAGASLDNQHAAQLRRYFSTKLEVRFGILTNGLDFRFFSDLERPNVMDDDPFMTLNMLNLDESLVDVLQLFTKAGFQKDKALQAARRAKDNNMIRHILGEELSSSLSNELVAYFVGKVAAGRKTAARRQELETRVREQWQEWLDSVGGADKSNPQPVEPADKNDHEFEVVEIPVFASYKGKPFEAVFLLEEKLSLIHGKHIRYQGEVMNHAIAADKAAKSIDPDRKGFPVGWTFWKFIDPQTGEEIPIREFWDNEAHWLRIFSRGSNTI